MNISVPDRLADEVRQLDIPISAVCQRALRDEVARLHAVEAVDDIVIIPHEESWTSIPADKPILIYRRHPVHGMGWTLFYCSGPEPGSNPDDHFIPGGRADVETVLRSAREWLQRSGPSGGMKEITAEVGNPAVTIGFTGRWLIEPDADETRSCDRRQDTGAYFGVALTARGRIAVLTAHCNDGWPPHLDDYDSLDQAAERVPADIIARAAAELGETRVLWRDI